MNRTTQQTNIVRTPSSYCRAGSPRPAGILSLARPLAAIIILLLAFMATGTTAAAAGANSLVAAMSGAAQPSAHALGSWQYVIKAGDDVIGNVTITSKAGQAVAGPVYLFTQTGEFYLGATESQRVTVAAKMLPDLSLQSYEKKVEKMDGGRTVSIEKTTIVVGALAVTITRDNGRKKETKTLKKPGPVCYAFGAAYIFARSAGIKSGASYEFISPSADGSGLQNGKITVSNLTSGNNSGAGSLLISTTIGNEDIALRLDSNGEIVDYGPKSGEARFILSIK